MKLKKLEKPYNKILPHGSGYKLYPTYENVVEKINELVEAINHINSKTKDEKDK